MLTCLDLHIVDPIAAREEEITSHIVKDSERKLFTCDLCQFGASSRYKAFCHIEAMHFKDSTVTYSCQFCGKTASSRNASRYKGLVSTQRNGGNEA